MDVYKIDDIGELLKNNAYAGRGIVIGKTPDGKTKFSLSGGKLVMDIPPYSGRMFLLRHETGSQK